MSSFLSKSITCGRFAAKPVFHIDKFYPFSTLNLSAKSVVDLIKSDHQEIINQYSIYQSSVDIDAKWRAARQFIKLLSIHSVCEEQVVYPVFRTKLPNGNQIADEAIKEHQELKNDLYELDKMKQPDQHFEAKITKILNELKKHAIEHEEQKDLPLLEQHVTREQLMVMGKQFLFTKTIAPTRPHPAAPTQPTLQKAAAAVATPIDKLKDLAEGV